MKTKWTGYVIRVMILAVILTGCAGKQKLSDKFDEEEVKAAAEEVIEILNEGDIDTLVDQKWNSVMKSMAGREMMTEQVLPIVEDLGAVAVVKVKYEKRKAQFTISFDEDMKVGGFYVK